jgi:transposase InsO family protein
MVLDIWHRSGLSASDFADLVGLSAYTLYSWKKRFRTMGPAGLLDHPRGGPRGSRLPEVTKRAILMMKEEHPDWGCDRISDLLVRGPALPASPSAVARVLKEEGYEFEEVATRPHDEKVVRFERSRPNELWQTDLFTFVLKRQNRRVYLVAFLDDASRFVVGWGLHASASTALVLEVLRASVASFGLPEEVLSDNGSQYVTWRGKSAFSKELEKLGIRHLVSKPRHPQTLGKIERFWGTLWKECLQAAVFRDLGDARIRIGHFVDHYNFQRPHRSLDGLFPADRYFGAAPEVLRTLKDAVAQNALEIARDGVPKKPFYLTGQVGGKAFSVHAEGERVILTRGAGDREEVELVGPDEDAPPSDLEEELPDGGPDPEALPPEDDDLVPPGTSRLDGGIEAMRDAMAEGKEEGDDRPESE